MAFSFGGFGTSSTGAGAMATNESAPTTNGVSSNSANSTKSPTLTVPDFESLFPWISIYARLSAEVSSVGETTSATSLQGQKFLHFLRSEFPSSVAPTSSSSSSNEVVRWRLHEALCHPDPLLQQEQQQQQQPQNNYTTNATPEEARLRESLRVNPYIMLHGKLTHVTPAIYQELMSLCNDLQIGIVHAVALYAHASDRTLFNPAATSASSTASSTNFVPRFAREVYFYERAQMLRALKLLLQRRLAAISAYCYDTMEVGEEHDRLVSSMAIVVATDELLIQNNLIATIIGLIQTWTHRLDSTSAMNSRSPFSSLHSQHSTSVPEDSNLEQFTLKMKRSFALQQRQSLAELLYLIAYQTQFSSGELVQLLDAIHLLTDTHFDTLLDPFINVPSIYNDEALTNNGETHFGSLSVNTASSPTAKPKQQWDDQVINDAHTSGAIASQSLIHTLIMATLCAMDASHALWDRNTHAPNNLHTQGANALFTPSGAAEVLHPIHQRLYEPSTKWKRREIWGLFRTAYALLLLNGSNSPATTTNKDNIAITPFQTPRQIDTKATGYTKAFFGDGESIDGVTSSAISSVTNCNTLHWIRTSLLPSFGNSATGTATSNLPKDDSSNGSDQDMERLNVFYKSTLAEFLSKYFNFAASLRELPTTRAQWTTDQESQMEYARLQEEQRRQFGLFASGEYHYSSHEDSSSSKQPTSSDDMFAVNYANRPDCLDDVLACIVAVILTCPACARMFWDVTETDTEDEENRTTTTIEEVVTTYTAKPRFIVTFAVLEVQRMVLLDPTITSRYLSLLSVLALTDHNIFPGDDDSEGAAALAIYQLLSDDVANPSDMINWNKLLYSLESYEMYLTPSKANRSPLPIGPTSNNRTSYELDNNGYYYGNTDDDEAYYSYDDPGTAKINNLTTPSKSSGTASTTGLVRSFSEATLSPEDEDCLKALLNLMTIICSRCKAAHGLFLDLNRSSVSQLRSGGQLQQQRLQDNKEPVILSLLFRLIVKPVSVTIKGALFNLAAVLVGYSTEAVGLLTWELLEASQVLPTLLLSGAGIIVNRGQNVFSPDRTRHGYHFSGDIYNSSSYGILHEINHVETFIGTYPATEGLLLLILSLVQKCGCPPDLGSQWRRPGGSPYIEFITACVLPRSIRLTQNDGPAEHSPLFFATPEDRYRLISRALGVLKAVICRYPVPPPLSSVAAGQKNASFGESFSSKLNGVELRRVTPPLIADKDISSSKHTAINDLKALYETEAVVTNGLFSPCLNLFEQKIEDSEFSEAVRDFQEEEWMRIPLYNPLLYQQDQSLASRLHTIGTESQSDSKHSDAPRPKSPGFTILADILGGGSLLKNLLYVMLQDGNVAALTLLEQTQDSAKQTRSLYKSGYLPDYETVKDFTLSQAQRGGGVFDVRGLPVGRSSEIDIAKFSRSKIVERNLQICTPSIYPVLSAYKNRSDSSGTVVSDDVLYWRLLSIELTLQLLCAAAARETSFAKAIQCCGLNSLNITPVMKFGSHLEVRTVSTIYRVSFLLQQAAGASPFSKSVSMEPLPVIASSVGYCPPACEYYNYPPIAKFALAMVTYTSKTLSPSSVLVAALCGKNRVVGARSLSKRFAVQLLAQRFDEDLHDPDRLVNQVPLEQKTMKMSTRILDLILSSLLDQELPTLAYALLGFLDNTSLLQISGGSEMNCFSAIVHLLDRGNFAQSRSSASIASQCYELLYLLCKTKGPVSSHVMGLLRRNGFWARHLTLFFDAAKENDGHSSKSLFETISAGWRPAVGDLQYPEVSNQISIMHSCAFLLSGVALELRICALDPSLSDSKSVCQHGFAPSRAHRFDLMCLLFGTAKPFMASIIRAMPIGQYISMESFTVGTALKDMLDSATRPLQGPRSVIADFRCVDLIILNVKLTEVPRKLKEDAINYARFWNHYVSSAAASSHLATAVDCLVASCTPSCGPMLLEKLDDRQVIDGEFSISWNDLLDLLNVILVRLSPSEVLLLDGDLSGMSKGIPMQNNTTFYGPLQSNSALPLSVAALRLVQCIMNMSLTEQRLIDLVESCYLMATAILGCAIGAASHDRAGVLSCALALVLPAYDHQFEFADAASMRSDTDMDSLADAFVEAATFLLYLSSINYRQASTSLSKNYTKLDEIATAARAGLVVILHAFDTSEHADDVTFVSQVLSTPEGMSNLSRLINMLSISSSDVCWILAQIASCNGTAHILINAGVASAVLSGVSATLAYDSNEVSDEMIDEMPLGLGTRFADPPSEMIGQLKLLTTLISTLPGNNRLASEIGAFLRYHVSIFGQLLSSFPRNGNISEAFLTCLAVLSSALCAETYVGAGKRKEELELRRFGTIITSGDVSAPSITSVLGNASHRIERNLIDFALHIASHPLPEIFLPHLPSKLNDLDVAQRRKFRQSEDALGKSWWDLVNGSGTVLPSPPFAVDVLNVGFSASPSRVWRSDDYSVSILAAKSLEMALAFLCNLTGSSSTTTLSLNPIFLGKGICRCVIMSRAIEGYLGAMLKGDNVISVDEASDVKEIVRETLTVLGPYLGRSSERLLSLALMKVQYLSREFAPSRAVPALVATKENIDGYCNVLLEVLEYTQVEQLGVGCVGLETRMGSERDFSQKTARALREMLTSLRPSDPY